MSFKNHDANGYTHDLDLPFISHLLSVSYPTRSGCREKNIQVTHGYFMLHGSCADDESNSLCVVGGYFRQQCDLRCGRWGLATVGVAQELCTRVEASEWRRMECGRNLSQVLWLDGQSGGHSGCRPHRSRANAETEGEPLQLIFLEVLDSNRLHSNHGTKLVIINIGLSSMLSKI